MVHMAVEADRDKNVGALDLPRVSVLEPVVRNFDLLTVLDQLLKDSVIVADTVAPSWDLHSCHTIEEAGG